MRESMCDETTTVAHVVLHQDTVFGGGVSEGEGANL